MKQQNFDFGLFLICLLLLERASCTKLWESNSGGVICCRPSRGVDVDGRIHSNVLIGGFATGMLVSLASIDGTGKDFGGGRFTGNFGIGTRMARDFSNEI